MACMYLPRLLSGAQLLVERKSILCAHYPSLVISHALLSEKKIIVRQSSIYEVSQKKKSAQINPDCIDYY